MTHSWFRVYHDMVRDRKIRRLSYEHRWLWIAVLTLASESPERGVLLIAQDVPVEPFDLADMTGLDEAAVQEGLDALEHLGLIERSGDTWAVTNWHKRQFASDDSTSRYRRWAANREKAEPPRPPADRPAPRLVSAADDQWIDPALDPYSPVGVVDAYCRAMGCTIKDLELQGDKDRAFGQALKLLERGYGAEKVARIVRWLRSDDYWLRRGIDLGTVLRQAGKWERSGEPESVEAKPQERPARAYGFNRALGLKTERVG